MAIARKDKLVAGYNGNLESVIIHNDADVTVESTNGVFVKIDGLMPNERETKKAVLADEADIAEDVLFIHNSEVMYDERKSKLEDFRIAKGKVARAYRLHDGDIVTLTVDLFDAVPTVGQELTVKNAGKLGLPADATNAKVVFEVIEDCGNELHINMKAFAVQVKRK